MRLCLLFALLLLSCLSVAQTPSTGDFKKTFPPNQTFQMKGYFNLAEANQGQMPFRPDRTTCFFIRSYNFERQGTEAPRLKNMTTCTPAKSDQFRQTGRPKAKLIPAK